MCLEAVQQAKIETDNIEAQIAAAYACDSAGKEEEAIRFYDAAWLLGVRGDQRAEFMLGYGSTLKNVGRLSESQEIFKQALIEYPDDSALSAFAALTLQELGESARAVALLTRLLVKADSKLAEYSRALMGYVAALESENHEK